MSKMGIPLRKGLLYLFAIISAILPIRIIAVLINDFVDSNSISFQMIDMSPSKLLLLDAIEIIVFGTLLILLFISGLKGKIKNVLFVCILIWICILLQALIEMNLPHYRV